MATIQAPIDKLTSVEEFEPTLKGLSELYHRKRDLFFALACSGVSSEDPRTKELTKLAEFVLAAVRRGFDLIPDQEGRPGEVRSGSHAIRFEGMDISDVERFFQELDGISAGGPAGKDYSGQLASEAEIRFKLGEATSWPMEHRRFVARIEAQPRCLLLSDEDRISVAGGMPAYVVYELLYCASKVISAPTVVFEGLRKQGPLKKGYAYCGTPRRAYDNRGNPGPRHDGMVYVVFVDSQNHVFDWDWVKEDPKRPGYPEHCQDRFDRIIDNPQEAVLTGLEKITPSQFTSHHAWYSEKGNCVFVYFSDEPAYAERENDEVTIFKSFRNDEVVGCKLKDVGKRKVKDEQPVTILLAESLKRQALVRQTSYYGTLIDGAESNSTKVKVPAVRVRRAR